MSSSTAAGDCASNPSWQPTVAAYEAADTDTSLRSWWASVSSGAENTSFANELGRSFGSSITSFECGIGDYSSCTAPACLDYQNVGDPAWAYLALISTVNLNALFNSIHAGISNGQQGFSDRIDGLARIFFPWSEPEFPFGDAAFWIVATVAMLAAVVPGLAPTAGLGVAAFAGAGIQHAAHKLEPEPNTGLQDLAGLRNYAASFGEATRHNLELWAEDTFSGRQDSNNNTILDYLADGSYVDRSNMPTNSEVESFYMKQMISRVVNAQWRTRKIFVTFTSDPDDFSGPNSTRYYSEQDGGVYYTYLYEEDGVLSGHLDKPWGLDHLNGSLYDITGEDVTKASAHAWRAAGFNYTREAAFEELQAALSSNGTQIPFKEGAGWSGTWTLPVCDIGQQQWNSQFGHKPNQYGLLPCCCGPNCTDTAAFVRAANMVGFQTLLYGCKEQLQHMDLDFNSIDYGFGRKKSLPLAWATWSIGMRVGIVFAFLGGGVVALVTILCYYYYLFQ